MATPGEATPQQAHDALASGTSALIDVRETWEWDEQRIPGAVLIPLAEIPQRLAEIPDDRDVYVHCRLGGRSSRAVDFLREHGRPRAINVVGGLEAWQEAGLPTEG
ncbi:MAG: rhodanese-like domain-containing protein [Candidatus Dormibacteraeota bacterium]|uniref:Rhodanese-like domain-containing protein n=1 Tax=Candidatus Amunia macphersoniae TaxID=3127014 RepID=A0A934NA50_9BACT|nr:rhodanese-like domain-containing protein [Candidatus Dormibacteraeota bacterium]